MIGLLPDLFNNAAFSVVQNDLSSKIAVSWLSGRWSKSLSQFRSQFCLHQKVRERLSMKPESSQTLEGILIDEKGENAPFATGALTWLLRSVFFLVILCFPLSNIADRPFYISSHIGVSNLPLLVSESTWQMRRRSFQRP